MTAFAPIVGHQPRLLILGSMPGRASLKQQQYYAHPRNAFWWIMSEVFGFPESLVYARRVDKLKHAGVAVWDVLYDCERQGSLDSRIVRNSEISNDFSAFLSEHVTIEKVLFNGAAAETIFRRHWGALISQKPTLLLCRMPSTSPAHASMTREQKKRIWCDQLLL